MEGHVVNGLDRQPLASIAATVSSLGFNCVRLPFSLEQYYENPYIDVRTSQTTARAANEPSRTLTEKALMTFVPVSQFLLYFTMA